MSGSMILAIAQRNIRKKVSDHTQSEAIRKEISRAYEAIDKVLNYSERPMFAAFIACFGYIVLWLILLMFDQLHPIYDQLVLWGTNVNMADTAIDVSVKIRAGSILILSTGILISSITWFAVNRKYAGRKQVADEDCVTLSKTSLGRTAFYLISKYDTMVAGKMAKELVPN